ncbi:uncharacterized protein B0H18DRAFT_974429 [Fomitopsis serialis]|uniref:uncharacterized protein n=1 Tax=Fomitopsis serialis TaxID=139415 RepID=UPI002008AFCB|nr:uncharacterized protein B0H18DRAFT_974429 [Neoantrodia serialis]KAH9936563.1 hypothetical protein B0H18DRAFT_974429 [Neoantrodia serialis]
MPKELPGLYWDEDKKRYFPLAMKPKPPIGHVAATQESGDEPSRKRRRVEGGTPTFSALEKLRTSCGSTSIDRGLCKDKTAGDFGSCFVMLGDSRGWLYSLSDDNPIALSNARQSSILLIGRSLVSAICSWGTRRVAASFGWPCKIFIREIQPSADVVCHDVATAVLQDRTLALVLPTGSDVLSVSLDNNLVYAGTRSGFVTRFDSRLFRRSPNSITHLNVIHQHAILVGTIRGDLEVHDLRFMRESEPLLQLSGHVRSSATRLVRFSIAHAQPR